MNKIKISWNRSILLLFSVELLAIFGIIMVYSASSYIAQNDYGNAFYFMNKQIIGVILGTISMFAMYFVDYKKLKKISVWLYVLSVILLVMVFIPVFSVKIYGARRWIKLVFFTIQPSELAKFCYIIFVANYFSNNPDRARTFKGILIPILFGSVICLLIILEPNMSITMCVAILMLSMLFACGVKFKHLAFFIFPVLLLVPLLIIIELYRLARLSAFLHPWESPQGEGYQLLQSLYALGSGGFFGLGLFKSRQKYKFLPFAESDFILSVIGEELGFFGILILFSVFAFVIYLGVKIAKNCKNLFGYILAVGIILIFTIQVVINALVVSGSMPPTGLPLPLISSGNTSIIAYMTAFGVLGNIGKDCDNLLTKTL